MTVFDRRPGRPPRLFTRALVLVLITVALPVVLLASAAKAVFSPTIDPPSIVDGIVVVAGADDDRYAYARDLAEEGVSTSILISVPRSGTSTVPPYSDTLLTQCTTGPIYARDGKQINRTCFAPDFDTTEGEARAATRIARQKGWDSLLVVTYWGHVSRVRMYFDQCFAGKVYVTDTPDPLVKSRLSALLHETGGYLKVITKPAC